MICEGVRSMFSLKGAFRRPECPGCPDAVPGEHALDADHEPVPERGDRVEEGVGPAGQVAVEDDGAGLVEDAEVHGPGVQVDAGVESVLLRVEPHHGLPVRRRALGVW